MPSQMQHSEQIKKNKELLSTTQFDLRATVYKDWAITIMFYTAVHLVERELAKIPYDSGDHHDRESQMFEIPVLKRVLRDYKALKAASIKTRYKCYDFSDDDAISYMKRLNSIERVLAS